MRSPHENARPFAGTRIRTLGKNPAPEGLGSRARRFGFWKRLDARLPWHRPIFATAALSLLCFPQGAFSTGHAVAYVWNHPEGNRILNWSFENLLETWTDSAANGLYATARRDPGEGEAASGRFVGEIQGSSATANETVLLGTPLLDAMPGTVYTLSFLVRSDGDITGSATPAVRLWKSRDTLGSVVTGAGTTYRDFAQAKNGIHTLGNWTLYRMAFTIPAGRPYLSVHLWRSTASGAGGKLYFDNVMLEEGDLTEEELDARRARHGHSVSWSDALGRIHQTQILDPAHPGHRRVEGVLFDSGGRLHRTPLPVAAPMPYRGEFLPNLLVEANGDYEEAGGFGFSEVEYAEEPVPRVIRRASPGEAWRLGGARTAETGFYFTGNLSIPGNIKNPLPDHGEREYRLDWARDEDSVFSLSWTNRKGRVVQTGRQDGPSSFAITRMDYYPAGGIRKVLTPLDIESEGEAYAEVRTYNAQGLLVSRHTRDRGLEKFWYNREGLLRYSQNDRQREASGFLFTYHDYDALGNPTSEGEQWLYHPDQEYIVDGNGQDYPWDKTESRGWLYGGVGAFEERTGISLDSLPLERPSPRINSLAAAWHRNPETDAPGFSELDRIVVEFQEYDARGRIAWQRKYFGPMPPDHRVQAAYYEYDAGDRPIARRVHTDEYWYPLMSQEYAYDGLGRVRAVTGLGGDTIVRYTYSARGELESVWMGEESAGYGTRVDYAHHLHGQVKNIQAVSLLHNHGIFRQELGYEKRAIEAEGVPALSRASHTGKITQQIYWYLWDVSNPLRVTNYSYDPLGRMIAADYSHGSGHFGSSGEVIFPLEFSGASDLDLRVEYDRNGRILGKRAGGVASGDSAVYSYQDGSYRLSSVSGKLSSSGSRNTDRYLNFEYDASGNLVRDVSKSMEVGYTYDGMPTAFRVRNDSRETVSHQFYDASGIRVSQVEVSRLSSGFPTYVIGNPQHWSEEGVYDTSFPWDAWGEADQLLNVRQYSAPDTVHFYIVMDEGETEPDPGELALPNLPSPEGEIPVLVHAVVKYSGAYDSLLARRAGRKLSARHSIALGGQEVSHIRELYDENGEVSARKVVATVFGRGVPVGRYLADEERYQFYVKNHLGSTVRVVDANGEYAETPAYDYQPYGEPQATREDTLNPVTRTFAGKELDPAVDLYYFGARWYDAELGMWISPDPAGQFSNPYAYGWDPVNYYDPDGLWKVGVGISFGYTRRGGFSLGLGVGLEDVNLGGGKVNTYAGADHNFKSGSNTYSAQAGGSACAVLCLGAGVGGSYDTETGYSAHAHGSVGVGIGDAEVGVEAGTNQYWTGSGQYIGGNAYGELYAKAPGVRAASGYSHGFGSIESGFYATATAFGSTASGMNYGATTKLASMRYDGKDGYTGYYLGKDLIDHLGSEPVAAPSPLAPGEYMGKRLFGTNWCGKGGGGGLTGALDAACYLHDKRYEAAKANGPMHAFTNNSWAIISADLRLAGSAFGSMLDQPTLGGAAVGALFAATSAYKFVGTASGVDYRKTSGVKY